MIFTTVRFCLPGRLSVSTQVDLLVAACMECTHKDLQSRSNHVLQAILGGSGHRHHWIVRRARRRGPEDDQRSPAPSRCLHHGRATSLHRQFHHGRARRVAIDRRPGDRHGLGPWRLRRARLERGLAASRVGDSAQHLGSQSWARRTLPLSVRISRPYSRRA